MKITGTAEEVILILLNLDSNQRIEVSVDLNKITSETKSTSGRKGAGEAKERWPQPEFYKEVQKKLIEKEMTFRELAIKLNMKQSYLSQILYGRRKGKAAMETIRKVSDLLEVSIL